MDFFDIVQSSLTIFCLSLIVVLLYFISKEKSAENVITSKDQINNQDPESTSLSENYNKTNLQQRKNNGIQNKESAITTLLKCPIRVWKSFLILVLGIFVGYLNCYLMNLKGSSISTTDNSDQYPSIENSFSCQNSNSSCTGSLIKQDFYRLAVNYFSYFNNNNSQTSTPNSKLYPLSTPQYQLDPENWKLVIEEEKFLNEDTKAESLLKYKLFIAQHPKTTLFSSITFAEDNQNSPEVYYDIVEDLGMNYKWNGYLKQQKTIEVGDWVNRYPGTAEKPAVRYEEYEKIMVLPASDKITLRGHEFFKYRIGSDKNGNDEFGTILVVIMDALNPKFDFLHSKNTASTDTNTILERKHVSTLAFVIGPGGKNNNDLTKTKFMTFTSEKAPFRLPSFTLKLVAKFMGPTVINSLHETALFWKSSEERAKRQEEDVRYKKDIFEEKFKNSAYLQDVSELKNRKISESSLGGYCYDMGIVGDEHVKAINEDASQLGKTSSSSTARSLLVTDDLEIENHGIPYVENINEKSVVKEDIEEELSTVSPTEELVEEDAEIEFGSYDDYEYVYDT